MGPHRDHNMKQKKAEVKYHMCPLAHGVRRRKDRKVTKRPLCLWKEREEGLERVVDGMNRTKIHSLRAVLKLFTL